MFNKISNSKKLRLFFKAMLGIFLLSVFLGICLNILFPLDKKLYDFKYSKIFYSKDMKAMRMKISDDGFWRFYTDNEKVPKLLKNSILVFEDKYFYKHFGVNIFSIGRALFNNLVNKTRIGASTISMQVVKIVEPKQRTYLNKIIEIFRTFQLELNYSKEEILNIYFNKAPYGGNIEGLRAATYFYFGKDLNELTTSEMAILTTIPKNPNINRPDRQKNLDKKRDKVLNKLIKNNLIDKSQYNRAKDENISSQKHDFLFDVIQYTNTLTTQHNLNKTDIKTTIDYELQTFIQNYLKKETKKYKNYDLYNSAAIVIDNKSLEIKAYIGSNDFYDKKNAGENDGVLMKKSPGSTLKPFVYALALDEGLITPKRMLLDIPLNFKGYTPKNYNGKFHGQISMEEALKLSLNIPVIDLQNQLGENSLYELLEKTGIGIKELKNTYGLALAVGGIDLSLLELTKLFTILANKGEYKYNNQKILSEESSYLISEILSNGYRSKFNGYWESSLNSKRVAFKTGTSSDAKHLYTIGYTPNHTIGLWFGNFDGKKTKGELTGLNTVSDSLIQIFERIEKNNDWFKKPSSIKIKNICADYFNNDNFADISKTCKNKVVDFVFKKEQKCMSLNTQKLQYLIKNASTNISTIAQNSCYKKLINQNPIIVEPIANKEYVFSKLIPKKLRVLKFECQGYNKKDILTLYLNGKIIKNNSYLQVEEGNYKFTCIQDFDKYSEIKFNIKDF